MIDIRQTQNYANYLEIIGWVVARKKNINYFIRKFPLLGSVLKLQRPEILELNTVRKLARKYNSFQIIIEPKSESQTQILKKSGFKLSKNPYLPSKTLQIDLTKTEKEIFGNFKKDAKAAINKVQPSIERGRAFTVKEYSTPDEIKIWRKGWKQNVNFKKYVPGETQLINLRKSFPQNDSLFLASHNITGRIIGGALFTISRESNDAVCYYWQGFSGPEGRSTLSQYTLLYRGILWAKRQGCNVFDFEGIHDPRFPNDSWLGFTHFKRSFGGHEVTYPGAFVKSRLPFLGSF